MRSQRNGWAYVLAGIIFAALILAGVVSSWPLRGAGEWTALAAWVTAGVALIAGAIAVGQLGETRRLRLEQAQPYVVVFMEPSQAGSWFVELVVRNFGATAAHDVRLNIDPAPRTQSGSRDQVWLPAVIPVLAPGQEWRTFWDTGERVGSDLPDRHEAVVAFTDSVGRRLPALPSILDWGVFENRATIELYGIHHAAKALRQIDKTLTGWRERPSGGLKVYVRDGDAKDARDREHFEQRRAPRAGDGSEETG